MKSKEVNLNKIARCSILIESILNVLSLVELGNKFRDDPSSDSEDLYCTMADINPTITLKAIEEMINRSKDDKTSDNLIKALSEIVNYMRELTIEYNSGKDFFGIDYIYLSTGSEKYKGDIYNVPSRGVKDCNLFGEHIDVKNNKSDVMSTICLDSIYMLYKFNSDCTFTNLGKNLIENLIDISYKDINLHDLPYSMSKETLAKTFKEAEAFLYIMEKESKKSAIKHLVNNFIQDYTITKTNKEFNDIDLLVLIISNLYRETMTAKNTLEKIKNQDYYGKETIISEIYISKEKELIAEMESYYFKLFEDLSKYYELIMEKINKIDTKLDNFYGNGTLKDNLLSKKVESDYEYHLNKANEFITKATRYYIKNKTEGSIYDYILSTGEDFSNLAENMTNEYLVLIVVNVERFLNKGK